MLVGGRAIGSVKVSHQKNITSPYVFSFSWISGRIFPFKPLELFTFSGPENGVPNELPDDPRQKRPTSTWPTCCPTDFLTPTISILLRLRAGTRPDSRTRTSSVHLGSLHPANLFFICWLPFEPAPKRTAMRPICCCALRLSVCK